MSQNEASAGARRYWALMAGTAAAVIAADQVTKVIVRGAVERGEAVALPLGAQIVNVRNTGIAFGLLADGGAFLLAVTGATLAIVLAWFATGPARPWLWLAIGLLVGGALGNMLDRIRAGEVTDFVDLPAWPAFNVADVAITAGVIVLVLLALGGEHGEQADAEAPADP